MSNCIIAPANRRGGFVLLCDKYRYVRNRTSNAKIIWRCTHSGCGSYLHTNLFDVKDSKAAINGKFHLQLQVVVSNNYYL